MKNSNPIDFYRTRCEKALAEQATISGWDSDLVTRQKGWIKEHAKKCHSLRILSKLGQNDEAIQLQAKILSSFAARFSAKLYETKYGKKAKKVISPVAWSYYENQVDRIPLKAGGSGCCYVHLAVKSNGQKRWLNEPWTRTRQAQRALANVLAARLPLNDSEYNMKGKGRDAAVAEIKRLIEANGVKTFIVFDLANYFSSVRPEHLQWLKLPKQVLEHTVFFNHKAVQFTQKDLLNKTKPARLGLPQGAMVSGIIASALLKREICRLDGVLGEVTYVDDGVLSVASTSQAHKIAQVLQMQFAKLPGGPISFKKIDVRDISEGFEFLGYWIQKTGGTDDGTLVVIPSHPSKMKFKKNLYSRFRKEGPTLDYGKAEDVFEQYFKRWRNSFAHWTPNPEELDYTKGQLECWIGDFPMPIKPS